MATTSDQTVKIERAGKEFTLISNFGHWAVYVDGLCVVFDIATQSDAENWIWRNYPVETTGRPGDYAAVYAEENGIDYATALVRCNMD